MPSLDDDRPRHASQPLARTMHSIAIAIPAYNEEGIVGFLRDIDRALARDDRKVSIHVVDDRSTTDMAERIRDADACFAAAVNVTISDRNKGHGPTVLTAYRQALETGADCILQVDGDGQFDAEDFKRLVDAIERGADVAVGVRQHRLDPWFRKVLTSMLRLYFLVLFGARAKDPNCPFRGYTREALEPLVAALPPEPLVPNVYLSALAARRGCLIEELEVAHRVRRGDTAQGGMWGSGNHRILIPRRLLRFVRQALKESFLFGLAFRRPQ